MLDAMRRLALDHLWVELGDAQGDPETWYRQTRDTNLGLLFPKLVEGHDPEGREGEDAQHYYTLRADPEEANVAHLEVRDMKPGDGARLPFNQASGSQSAALGPVIKRTPGTTAKPPGPSGKIQKTTLKAFGKIAREGKTWSTYFARAHDCFQRGVLCFKDERLDNVENAYAAAVERIDERGTVFLAYRDSDGKLPGEVPEYVQYLQEVLTRTKYETGQTPAIPGQTCPLCGRAPVVVYPNALRGAGINIANLDRPGAFPGLEPAGAWKGYALCVGCADLLYVYCRHVARDYLAPVAGHKALVLPCTQADLGERKKLTRRFRQLAEGIEEDATILPEDRLLSLLGNEQAVTSVTFLWATFGQRMEDLRGVVTDVLPSRLRQLGEINQEITGAQSPLFPHWSLDEQGFQYRLSLSILWPLLRRPGGQKARSSNDSLRLFDLRRDLAEAIYHGRPLPLNRFFDEVMVTARWHLDEVRESGNPWGLLNEGHNPKTGKQWLTLAGWVKQLSRFLHYLRLTGVLPAMNEKYQPECEALKPYFDPESAIDTPAKAFAFLLGVLYGQVMRAQGARGVNVGANALTWLKRLTLTGKDLPDLYCKIREKLLAYENEKSQAVRNLITEVGELGVKVGPVIDLNETWTCYFLLLGQSLTTKILPRKAKKAGTTQGASA
jgi:CRISPR-associated protein Csh1